MPPVLLQFPRTLTIEPLATWITPSLLNTSTSIVRSPGPSATIVPWLMTLPSPSTSTSLLIDVLASPKTKRELLPKIRLASPLTPKVAPLPERLISESLRVWSLSILRIALSPKLALPVKLEPLVSLSLAPLRLLRLRLPSTSTSSRTLLPLPKTKPLPSLKIRFPPVIVPPLNSQSPVLLFQV